MHLIPSHLPVLTSSSCAAWVASIVAPCVRTDVHRWYMGFGTTSDDTVLLVEGGGMSPYAVRTKQ